MSVLSYPVYADLYVYRDQYGKLHMTDKVKKGKFTLLKKTRTYSPRSTVYRRNKRKFSYTIKRIAKKYKVESALIHAIIHAESGYNPKAKSNKGAVGLMQLMPATAKRYGINNRWDPESNIRGGTKYIKYLIKLFNNDLKLVVAAYNAGENAVKRYGNKIPPYNETEKYVVKVMEHYNKGKYNN
jgi:soluble lytic murein transglycosylase-like protein